MTHMLLIYLDENALGEAQRAERQRCRSRGFEVPPGVCRLYQTAPRAEGNTLLPRRSTPRRLRPGKRAAREEAPPFS
jgi:hypothetical protein